MPRKKRKVEEEKETKIASVFSFIIDCKLTDTAFDLLSERFKTFAADVAHDSRITASMPVNARVMGASVSDDAEAMSVTSEFYEALVMAVNGDETSICPDMSKPQ
jgi:hypothetical protein